MTLQLKLKETWKCEKAANFCPLILQFWGGFFYFYLLSQEYEQIQALLKTWL